MHNRALTDEKIIHLQNINTREEQMVFHRVQMIFRDHETRTLQGLLNDYKKFLNNYGWPPLMLSLVTPVIFWKDNLEPPLEIYKYSTTTNWYQ